MKALILTPGQWDNIQNRIKKLEKPSVLLSRSKMREVLGFTVRIHRSWEPVDQYPNNSEVSAWYDNKEQRTMVHLDFYDERKRTMFLLKYGNGEN